MLENDGQQQGIMECTKNYLQVETEDEVKEALKSKTPDEMVKFYKAIPKALTGFLGI